MEGNGFRDRIREFEAKNIVILGASFDAPGDNKKFCDKFSYPYKLLSFPHDLGKTYDSYDASSPQYAKRISYLIGPDRYIVKAFAKVKPAEHPAEVLSAVTTRGTAP